MLLTVHVEKSLGAGCIAGPVSFQRAQCGPNFASQVSTSTEERWPIRSVFETAPSAATCSQWRPSVGGSPHVPGNLAGYSTSDMGSSVSQAVQGSAPGR